MIGATGVQLVVLECSDRLQPVGRAVDRLKPAATRRVPDATWVRLARVAEGHGCTILVSAPYALTGTTSEATVLSYGSRARWLGSGRSPRVLAGVETRLRLEKHRHKRTGESVTVFFKAVP